MNPHFPESITPAEADAILADAIPRFPSVTLPLSRCQGRILHEPIRSDRAQPPFDRVAMDGIAISHSAWLKGSRRFAVKGMQRAGEKPKALASEETCLEVMTGSVLPTGADCVVPVEAIRILDGYAMLGDIGDLNPYRNVHRAGADCAGGEIIVPAGVCLTAPHLGAAAAFGFTGLRVSETPAIAVIATGDELVDPSRMPLPHQIRRSNPSAIEAALRSRKIDRVASLHAKDDPGRLRKCLEGVLGKCQAVILTGGVSMGQTDHVPSVLGELGIRPRFHKIRQKPGKPFWFGMGAGGIPVFALPGNPAAVLVCLYRYVLPALSAAMGSEKDETFQVTLAERVEPAKLTQFRPVAFRPGTDGKTGAFWIGNQGSGDFSGWGKSEGFVELPPGEAGREPGIVARAGRW